MTAYPQGAPGPQGGEPQYSSTQEMGTPPQAPAGQGWQQPAYQQGPYGQEPYRRRERPRVHVRSTFLTTEFWVLVVLSLAILIAAAVTDDAADRFGFSAQEAWKYITWLGIGYMVSRGLTKLGGNRRDGGDRGPTL